MGGRILYGPALLGIAIALTEPLLHDRVMGLVELRSVRFRRPVRSGATITASLTVHATARPREGKPGLLAARSTTRSSTRTARRCSSSSGSCW